MLLLPNQIFAVAIGLMDVDTKVLERAVRSR